MIATMPISAPHPCAQPGCGALVPRGTARCPAHERRRHTEDRERRGSAASRGYDGRWQKARRTYLLSHPLCLLCEAEGRVVPATVVDHIVPHRGDQRLFWASETNWQPLCKRCHDRKTATEDGGFGR